MPNSLRHGEGRLADLALAGRKSFIVTAQQDTSERHLAAKKRTQGESEVRRPERDHKVNTAGLTKTVSATILIIPGL